MMSNAGDGNWDEATPPVSNGTIGLPLFQNDEDVTVPKRRDRRIERTQRLIREALLSLIREKGFEALTVQEIIDRANVGRATFYAHFDNKDDLLASGFEDLRASLSARQREALSRGGTVEDRVFGFSEDQLYVGIPCFDSRRFRDFARRWLSTHNHMVVDSSTPCQAGKCRRA